MTIKCNGCGKRLYESAGSAGASDVWVDPCKTCMGRAKQKLIAEQNAIVDAAAEEVQS